MRGLLILLLAVFADATLTEKKHKHHHGVKHKHHHHHHALVHALRNATDAAGNATEAPAEEAAPAEAAEAPEAAPAEAAAPVVSTEKQIKDKIKELEKKIDVAAAAPVAKGPVQGRIIVNGPLPTDFNAKFAAAVAKATGCSAAEVHVLSVHAVAAAPAFVQLTAQAGTEVEVVFEAPAEIVELVEEQAGAADSNLVNGELHDYLVADDGEEAAAAPAQGAPEIDTEMPYGELEPFGREDTAQELTDQSIHQSDEMVDQLERAEVAEEKRSVFRAITRLRGAAITSFDGIARSQTGNIDEYAHLHKWRETHPLHHLADEEADVSKWAFPDNAD